MAKYKKVALISKLLSFSSSIFRLVDNNSTYGTQNSVKYGSQTTGPTVILVLLLDSLEKEVKPDRCKLSGLFCIDIMVF
jgi:hypothetical protein